MATSKPVVRELASNRRARHDYHILEAFEAGIELTGTEVKAARAGKVQLKDSYVEVRNGEAKMTTNETSNAMAPVATESGSRTDHQAKIGLLLVHGIGEQREGTSAASLIEGLKLVFGENIANDQPSNTVSIEGRSIRLYEVYWADLLDRERVAAIRDSFDIMELFPLPWFPWLHLKDGLYPANSYSRWSVFWRCLLLSPAIGGLLAAWAAASLLQGLILIVCALLRVPTRDYLGHVLDGFLGDVGNYVKSAGRVRAQDSPLYNVAGQIQARFHQQLTQACKECSEVQILAHSLGTFVAYHGVTGYNLRLAPPATAAGAQSMQPLALLTHIYTIGCPLEKIRFFWPKLITEDLKGLVAAASAPVQRGSGERLQCRFQWDNFYNPLDVVAGKLKTFNHWVQVRNHTLWQGGLATAHIVYEKNPAFLSVIGKGLSGKQCVPRLPVAKRVRDFLGAGIETIALPAILLFLIALGWAFILGLFWSIGFLVSLLFDSSDRVQTGVFLLLTFLFLVGLFLAPWETAKKEHKAHWGKEAQ